jgi:hypothetical protein
MTTPGRLFPLLHLRKQFDGDGRWYQPAWFFRQLSHVRARMPWRGHIMNKLEGRMETQQRIICQWCGGQNLMGSTACQSCGAPLDVRDVVVDQARVAAPGQSSATPVLEYRSAPVEGDNTWKTVATFDYCGQLHAARAVLSRLNIISRIAPAYDDSPQFDLQTISSDAEFARAVLVRTMPKEIAVPRGDGSPTIPPRAALQLADTENAGYSSKITLLWIVVILIVLSVYWVCR